MRKEKLLSVFFFMTICVLLFRLSQLEKKNGLLELKVVSLQNKIEKSKMVEFDDFEEYSKEDFEVLREEFVKLVLNPVKYEPEEILPLFYYVCGNTDIVKDIYDRGDSILAEQIIHTHMNWSGQYRIIQDFIKTWAKTTISEEDSEWSNIIYEECIDAFKTFKSSTQDLETAKKWLPEEVMKEIEANQ